MKEQAKAAARFANQQSARQASEQEIDSALKQIEELKKDSEKAIHVAARNDTVPGELEPSIDSIMENVEESNKILDGSEEAIDSDDDSDNSDIEASEEAQDEN